MKKQAEKKTAERNIISDKLLVSKTKKTMEEWFHVLDEKGAKKMSHADIFKVVSEVKGLQVLGQWNHNLLTTTYQWSRGPIAIGLKERGQKENGFGISVSRTIPVTISKLYNAWLKDELRIKWLGKEKIIIREATKNRSARITWSDGLTSLSVDFYTKGENKSQVVVQHLKIPDSKLAKTMKEYWGYKLDKLREFLS